MYIKGIEHRISSDLYADTARGNVCDIFHCPTDVFMDTYPTNLPHSLEIIVNGFQGEAKNFAHSLITNSAVPRSEILSESVLNAVQMLGQTRGLDVGRKHRMYKCYDCSELLTRNEINYIAGSNFSTWLTRNGFNIREANFTRDTVQNIVATRNSECFHILLAAEVAPVEPPIFQLDLDNLYEEAQRVGAIPCYASVSVASANEKHLNDGVVLAGDDVRFRVNAFDRFEAE